MTALSPEAIDSPKPQPREIQPREIRPRRTRPVVAVHRNLVLLAALCVGCGLVFLASLLLHHANEERRAIEAQATGSAHAIASAVDREIAAAESRLEALASSPALFSGDIGAFYGQLSTTRVPDDTWLVLTDTRRQLLNTLRPLGASLPKIDDYDPLERQGLSDAIRSGKLYVSNRIRGPVAQIETVAVSLPVLHAGEVAFLLTAGMSSQRLRNLIDEQHLPPGWGGIILDRNGQVVTRSPAEGAVTAPAQTAAFTATPENYPAEGILRVPAGGGEPSDLIAFTRSARAGWIAATALPLAIAEAPKRRALQQIAGGGALLLLVGGGAAWALSRRSERHTALPREAQERQQSMMDALSAQIAVLDERGTILAVNAAWRRFADAGGFGSRPCGIGASYLGVCDVAHGVCDVAHKESDGSSGGEMALGAVMRCEGDALHLIPQHHQGPGHQGPILQGAERWFRIHVARFGADADLRLLVMHEDITEARHTEDALRQLTGQLMRLQDEERRRIARDLHDSTAQNLLGAALGIDRALRLTQFIPYRAECSLRESKDLIEQSQREIRTVAYLLHPPMLDEAGLPSALRWYIDGFAKRSGIAIDFEVAPELVDRRMPAELETALFRVVQEALANVCRHSGSATARIELGHRDAAAPDTASSGEVRLTIVDTGRGMPSDIPDLAFAGSKPGSGAIAPGGFGIGVGLPGMRERLRQFGGRLDIDSNATGTTVRAIVPVGPEDRASG